jgi:hypothetical protein
MSIANFAAGANDELQRVLIQKFIEQTQRQKLAQEQQQIEMQARRDATQAELGHGRLDLDRQELGQRGEQFQTNSGFKEREMKLEEGMQPVRLAHTAAQTADIQRRPLAEQADREHDVNVTGLRHKNSLAEIGAQGAEQRRTEGVRIAGREKAPVEVQQNQYATERTQRIRNDVATLKKKVSGWTAGAGSALGMIPGTPARDFTAELNTLKSNIAFGELAEMRAASKTGGALGAISEKELTLLESALGALDQGQSPGNLSAQLDKIVGSLERWENAKSGKVDASGAPPVQNQNDDAAKRAAELLKKYGG